MFDENIRKILEEGQEPVPAHVWNKVEADLDRLAHRRTVALWFRRASVGVAAAAAVAIGLFMNWRDNADIVSPVTTEGMIAVIEENGNTDNTDGTLPETPDMPALLAMAEKPTAEVPSETSFAEEARPAVSATEEINESAQEQKSVKADHKKASESEGNVNDQREYFPDIWPEDEPQRKKAGVSLVVSGITGTNSAQNKAKINPAKRPGVTPAPMKTGITETSTKSTYGIPVSFGAGARIALSPRWSIGAGLNYTFLTRKFYGTYTSVSADGSVANTQSEIKNIQHYIGIPVNAYYNIVNQDNIHFYAYAGGTAEKCVGDKYHVLSNDIRHKETVKRFQYSVNAGIGVEFMLSRYLGLYIDPSIRYYFDCRQPKSIRTDQPLMFGLEMGFRVQL